MKCRICGGECSQRVKLRGTLYGTVGNYRYMICDECGCMQIEEIPDDLSSFYDNTKYYSLNMDKRKLKNRLLYLQMKNQVIKHNFWGMLTQILYPVDYSCFKLIDRNASILDVGCGDGELLRWLVELGFNDVNGIDPYAQDYKGNYSIVASDIRNYNTGKMYDMITMFHVLEHLDDQKEVISKAVKLLKPDGFIVVMLPFFSQYYWNKYGDTLYTLDPPRHLYIHTKSSISYLFENNDMKPVYFNTELDPGIPEMAVNVRNGHPERNNGSSFLKSSFTSFFSMGLRKKIKKNDDGAIATFIFKKTGRS